MEKLNCWEFMGCGREKGGRNVSPLGVCPAYPHHGRECANVVGTFCDLVQVLRTARHADCHECEFYNSPHFDENAKKDHQYERYRKDQRRPRQSLSAFVGSKG